MSMQMRVVHTTEFEYDGLAAASYNQARMTPVTAPGQIVVHTRLAVHPKPWTSEYRDYFGSHVVTFEFVSAARRAGLLISAAGALILLGMMLLAVRDARIDLE